MTIAGRGVAFGLILVAALGCDSKRADAPGATQGELNARCSEGAAIPIAPLTVEWQEGDGVHRLALGSDGHVQHDGKPFGRFQGACLLDARGRILTSVDAKGGATDGAGARRGAFQSGAAPLLVDGKTVAIGEEWIGQGDRLAVDDEGTVLSVTPQGQAFTLPAGVDGDFTRARRAALLLLVARP